MDIIEGIIELHSCGLLALNLKPCNFLLDDQDTAILGEFGTPILFFDNAATKSQPVPWMGTPNYMAPEQWGPSVRGPISTETDAWGFAASMVEMVTGTRPWDGMTADEIYNTVVVRRQKPVLPGELPPAVSKVLKSCFEYDYRQRPSFKEILRAFTRYAGTNDSLTYTGTYLPPRIYISHSQIDTEHSTIHLQEES